MISVALYENELNPVAAVGRVPWATLAQSLAEHDATECAPCPGHRCEAKKGQAWSPVELIVPRRADSNVRAVSALVLDFDGASLAPEAAKDLLAARQFILHTTHSHGSGGSSFRVVLALTRAVAAHEWPSFWAQAVSELPEQLRGSVDPACKNLSRLYYYPSHSTAPHAPPYAVATEGELLDVDAVLARAARPAVVLVNPPSVALPSPAVALQPAGGAPLAPAGLDLDAVRAALTGLRKTESKLYAGRILRHEPLAAPGGRDNAVNTAASLLASIFDRPMPVEHAMHLLHPALERMDVAPEGLVYWQSKALGCYERAAKRKLDRVSVQEADKSAMLSLMGAHPTVQVTGEDWRSRLLVRTGPQGEPTGFRSNDANVALILAHDAAWRDTLRFNALTKSIDIAGGPLEGVSLADLSFAAAVWLQRSGYRLDVSPALVGPALLHCARLNTYDPLANYLEGLTWDGVPRLNTYLQRFCKAAGNMHVEVIGRKWALGAVARALAPGCKMDNLLVLIGDYGTRKTGFVETMAGKFYSNGRIDFQSKDSRMLAARYWLVEIAEMAGYRRADNESVKDWLSTRIDSYRPPYGAAIEDFPRRAVFVGTANDVELFLESNRREWPVEIESVDVKRLEEERDQIWAEAVVSYREGEPWWLEKDLEAAVRAHSAEFSAPSPARDMVYVWWTQLSPEKRPLEVTVVEVAQAACGYTRDRISAVVMREVSRALTSLGWHRFKANREGSRAWKYRAMPALMEMPQEGTK